MENKINVLLNINYRYNENCPNEQLDYIVSRILEDIDYCKKEGIEDILEYINKLEGKSRLEIESLLETFTIDTDLGLSLKLFDTVELSCLNHQSEEGLQLLHYFDDDFILILTERNFYKRNEKEVVLRLNFELNFNDDYLARFRELSGQPK